MIGSDSCSRGWWCLELFLMRGIREKLPFERLGELRRAGLLPRDLEGERPRLTSSFKAEKKPCFFSIGGKMSGRRRKGENKVRLVTEAHSLNNALGGGSNAEGVEEQSVI
jgi:hypothetical protein